MKQNNGLQLLRFIAAGLVLLVHLPTYAVFPFFAGEQRLFSGAIGVDVFFCISGLVMYLSVGRKTGPAFALQFAIRRLFRVVPLYFLLTVLLYVVLSVRAGNFSDLSACLGKSLAFAYCGTGNGYGDPIIPMGWSLNYEMFFYACLLLGLLTLKENVLRHVALLLVAIAVFGWLTNDHFYYVNSIVIEFVFGILLGMYGEQIRRRIPKPAAILLVGLVALLFFGAMVGIDGPESDAAAVSRMTIHFGAAGAWPRWIVWGLPSLFLCAAFYWLGERVPARLARLGDFSYSVYLSQVLVMAVYAGAVKFVYKKLNLALEPSIVHTLGIVALTCGAAYALYYLIELPWMNLGKRAGTKAVEKAGLAPSRSS